MSEVLILTKIIKILFIFAERFSKLFLWYEMKRLFLSFAAVLCCSLCLCQEVEDEGNTFLVIPRFDVNPYIPSGSASYTGFDLSNTSLYTLIEGAFGDSDFSYSIEGHLLSTDPSSLYANSFRSDEVNWLDWANVTYAPGNWYFTLGKDILSIGSFEEDEYDFDQHINLCSSLWNNLQVYQWSAKAAWANDDGSLDASFQVASSPYGARPFKSGLYAYSLALWSEGDSFYSYNSLNALGCGDKAYVLVVSSGNKLILNDFEIGLDATFRGYDFDFNELSLIAFTKWSASENFNLTLKGGYERLNGSEDVFGWNPALDGEDPHDYFVPASLALINAYGDSYFFGGATASCYLCDNLRLHTTLAANNWSRSLSVNIGATYFLEIKRLFK